MLSGVATRAAKAVCAASARNTSLRAKRSTSSSILRFESYQAAWSSL